MLNCAPEIIILSDHTKFSRPAFANFAKPDQVTTIITDKKLPEEISKNLKKSNIKINFVP